MSNIIITILVAFATALIGYYLGTLKFFRENKLKAYKEILPPIISAAYNPQGNADEKEFNTALALLWLYSSKDVAVSMDKAVSIIVDPRRGNFQQAVQESIVKMRYDIWPPGPFKGKKILANEIQHLYMRIAGGQRP